MFNSRTVLSVSRNSGLVRRTTAGGVAVMAAVASGLMFGPVTAANAATDTVNGLAAEFAAATNGATITLTQNLVGTMGDDAVVVPAGTSLILDLAGNTLSLVGHDLGAGLGVRSTASLTIIDTGTGGTLTVVAGNKAAGIGGGDTESGGTVNISGGTVTATGGNSGAGIGGGYSGSGGGGTVDISGGTVTAVGGGGGAGIGGGYHGIGALVSIGAGATVTASGDTGIAIGAGEDGTGFGSLSNAGELTIPLGNRISIPSGVTVNNSGIIRNAGTLIGAGTLQNNCAIVNSGTIDAPANVTAHNTTVTLAGNGGVAPTNPPVVFAASFHDGQVTFPAAASRTGYRFTGWFTAVSGGSPVTATTDLGNGGPKNTTLYAQWTINQFTVTLDSQSGSTVAPALVNYNTPVTEPSAPARAGYTFHGWFTTATGNTKWDFTTPITADVTLYAQWDAVPAVVVAAQSDVLASTGTNLPGWPLAAALALIIAGLGAMTVRSQTRRRES